MTKLTSLVLRKKEINEQKPALKQQFKSKLQVHKRKFKSAWNSLCPQRENTSSQRKENIVGPILTINLPITIYNTNVNNYYSGSNKDGNNSQIASSSTSIVQQLIVLSPFQIYGFLFVCSLLLIVVGFGILQVHRIITILQTLLDGIKYFVLGFLSNSLKIFSLLKSFM